MAFGASDIPALLADTGVDVIFGAVTVKGLLDREVPEALLPIEESGGVAETVSSVVIKTGSLPGIAGGSAITVDGVSWKVRSVRPMEDGELTMLLVRRP